MYIVERFEKARWTAAQEAAAVESAMLRIDRKMASLLLKGFVRTRESVDMAAILRLLSVDRDGSIVSDSVIGKSLADNLRPGIVEIQRGVSAGAETAISGLPPTGGGLVVFDPLRPSVLRVVEQQAAKLVVDIENESRKAIQSIVRRGFLSGTTPREMAKEIKGYIGLTDQAATAVSNYHRSLLKSGLDENHAEKLASRYADRHLKSRAMTIARTESAEAINSGRRELWTQAIDRGDLDPKRVEREWITARDDAACPYCRPMDAVRVSIGMSYATPKGAKMGPPLHPNCRCSERMVRTTEKARKPFRYEGIEPRQPRKSLKPTNPAAVKTIKPDVQPGSIKPVVDIRIPTAKTRDEVLASVHAVENEIKNAKIEYMKIFDQDGNLIASRTGEATSVTIDRNLAKMTAGKIVTHNHPRGESFSMPDVEFLLRNKVAEVRAVTSRWRYSIAPSGDVAPNVDKVMKSIKAKHAKFARDEAVGISGAVQAGILTEDEAIDAICHNTWTRIAADESLGLKYTREAL